MKFKWEINVSKNPNANVTSVTRVSQVVTNLFPEIVTEDALATMMASILMAIGGPRLE